MKGLLLKDLLNLKQMARVWSLLLAVFIVIGFAQRSPAYVGGMLMMLTLLLPMNALAYDENAKWDRYALTMPFSRRDLVMSKYLLAVLGAAATSAITLLCGLVMGVSAAEALWMTGLFLALGLGLSAVILPVLFRFGVQKGRMVMLLIVLLPMALAALLPDLSASLGGLSGFSLLWLLPLAAAALAASCWISARIYRRKEF